MPPLGACLLCGWVQIMLKSLINNYGTHYIRGVWYGGVGRW